MHQIFTWHAVCVFCACVRKSKQASRGGKTGTGCKGQLAAVVLKANCQRHLTKIFSYARAIVGPPFLLRLALLQFSPTTFPLLPLPLATFHATFEFGCLLSQSQSYILKISLKREKSHSNTLSNALFPSLSLPLSLSLCNTHVNTFSHRLVAFVLFLLLLLFLLCIFLSRFVSKVIYMCSSCLTIDSALPATPLCLPRLPSSPSFSLSVWRSSSSTVSASQRFLSSV